MEVQTEAGIVTVTNVPTVTRYYRGRYYRVSLTVSTTPSGFKMTSRDTFYGRPALRWFNAEDVRHEVSYRYTYGSEVAPF